MVESNKKYFNILAPFTGIDDVGILKNAGADELYCGYVTKELTKKWPLAFNILNRRGEGQSFETHGAFKEAVGKADAYGLPVYVTINGLYTPPQYSLLLDLVAQVGCLKGVKGIIVADLGLLLTLKKNNFKKEIHISTGGTCFNAATADFYQQLGARRVILDRQLTADEIADVIKNVHSDIDIEIFAIAEGCGGFIDGYCTFLHCGEIDRAQKLKKGIFLRPSYVTDQIPAKGCSFYNTMMTRRGFKVFDVPLCKERQKSFKFYARSVTGGCRLCDLYSLYRYPIKSLKIVGRGGDPHSVSRLVKAVSQAMGYLKHGDISKNDYQKNVKRLFSSAYLNGKRRCTKFDCYFSPHWVGNGK